MGFLYWKRLCILAGHIPGTINIKADKHSRVLEDATKSKTDPAIFQTNVITYLENQT